MSSRLNYTAAYMQYMQSVAKWQTNATFHHHYSILYTVELNIRNYEFTEMGSKSLDNTQETWCGDCVHILAEIYDCY